MDMMENYFRVELGEEFSRCFSSIFGQNPFLQEVLLLACLGLPGHEGGQLHVGDIHLWPGECIDNLPAKHRVAEWSHC